MGEVRHKQQNSTTSGLGVKGRKDSPTCGIEPSHSWAVIGWRAPLCVAGSGGVLEPPGKDEFPSRRYPGAVPSSQPLSLQLGRKTESSSRRPEPEPGACPLGGAADPNRARGKYQEPRPALGPPQAGWSSQDPKPPPPLLLSGVPQPVILQSFLAASRLLACKNHLLAPLPPLVVSNSAGSSPPLPPPPVRFAGPF